MFSGILALTNIAANAGEYNIVDFGAVRNTLSTAAVQRAIEDFEGTGNPNSPENQKIKLVNTTSGNKL